MGTVRSRLGIPWATLHHHVAALRAAGELRVALCGRRALLFHAERAASAAEIAARAMVQGDTARAIAAHVVSRPGHSIAEMSVALGRTERVVYYHVRRLIDAGLLQSSAPTRLHNLTPSPMLAFVLEITTNRA